MSCQDTSAEIQHSIKVLETMRAVSRAVWFLVIRNIKDVIRTVHLLGGFSNLSSVHFQQARKWIISHIIWQLSSLLFWQRCSRCTFNIRGEPAGAKCNLRAVLPSLDAACNCSHIRCTSKISAPLLSGVVKGAVTTLTGACHERTFWCASRSWH